jgi:hypothetical protein
MDHPPSLPHLKHAGLVLVVSGFESTMDSMFGVYSRHDFSCQSSLSRHRQRSKTNAIVSTGRPGITGTVNVNGRVVVW